MGSWRRRPMNLRSTSLSEQLARASSERTGAGHLMDDLTIEGFLRERERLSSRLPGDVQSAADKLKEALPHWRKRERGVGARFIKLSASLRDRLKLSTYVDLNKFLIADLSLSLDATLIDRDLPDEVTTL